MIGGYCLARVLEKFVAVFPRSFTACEMLIVVQGAMTYLMMAFGCVLSRYLHAKREPYCAENKASEVMQVNESR